MKKISMLLLFLLAVSPLVLAQTDDEPGGKDFYKPTPGTDKKWGLISITGNMGPAFGSTDDFVNDSPYLKIGFYYNINKHFSLGLIGTVLKYQGPESFILEQEGYDFPIHPRSEVAEDYATISQIDESAYGPSLVFRPLTGSVGFYIFGNLLYTSIDYEQLLLYRRVGQETFTGIVYWRRIGGFKATAGAGVEIMIADYIGILFEGEYTTFLDFEVFEDKYDITIGVRVII